MVVSFRRAGEVRLRIVDFKAGKEGLMGGKKTWRKVGLAVATAGQSALLDKKGIQTTWNRLNGDGGKRKSGGSSSSAGVLTGGGDTGPVRGSGRSDVDETLGENALSLRRRRAGSGIVGAGTFSNTETLGG